MLNQLKKSLQEAANPERAKILARFFKTGRGQYGEGDIFLGVKVPEQRKIAKQFSDLNLKEIQELLDSKIHEERLVALFILIDKYKKSDDKGKKEIFKFYLSNSNNVNNWDLVDLSAPNIIGNFLLDKKSRDERKILYKLANSSNLWEKRIAILSTYTFIKNNEFDDVFKISEILLKDAHDLIHKAVGWMLREVGKRSQEIEEEFLKKHCKNMPRTMLRYAIEKFDENKRKNYLNGKR